MCKCIRCGKELKSEESKKRGYGPTCFKIVSFQKNKKWKLRFRKGLNTLKYRKKREIIIQNIINTPEVVSPVDNNTIQDLANRMRKIELDNAYLKARAKHVTITNTNTTPHDTNLERIKQEESQKITDPTLKQYRNVFHDCVRDLKEMLSKHGIDNPVLKEGTRFSDKELGIKIIDFEKLEIVRE